MRLRNQSRRRELSILLEEATGVLASDQAMPVDLNTGQSRQFRQSGMKPVRPSPSDKLARLVTASEMKEKEEKKNRNTRWLRPARVIRAVVHLARV